MERVHKFLARAGVASRRKCEELIAQGRVAVNGSLVSAMGATIDPGHDLVTLDGAPVQPRADNIYLALNKPSGYITTAADTHNRRTVFDLLPPLGRRVYPVGRLDMESEGLLILTDDGELAFGITHPSREAPRTYLVDLRCPATESDLAILRGGVELFDGITLPAEARFVDSSRRTVEVQIREGRKRQVRRMFGAIGNEVVRLVRVKLGCVALGALAPGQTRSLTQEEVDGLKRLAKNPKSPRSTQGSTGGDQTGKGGQPDGSGASTSEVRLQGVRQARSSVPRAPERLGDLCRDSGTRGSKPEASSGSRGASGGGGRLSGDVRDRRPTHR
ncbi:MAG: pseudouridine synthase [Clostridia bacterium]|nr:pseudouridine synthase [Clostridia bacterium]